MPDIAFRWEAGFDPGYILRQIDKIRKIEKERVSFSASEYHFWLPILNSSVNANGKGRKFKNDVIEKALSDRSAKLQDPKEFLTLCEAKLAKITAATLNDYVIFCKITHVGPRLLNKLENGNAKIVWDPPKGGKLHQAILSERMSEKLHYPKQASQVTDNDEGLTTVLVFVKALNPQNAYDIGIEALDCLRGILNLLINTQRGINPFPQLSNKPTHSINRIRLAPYQTVHKMDGSFAAEMFWYEPRWSHAASPIKFEGSIRDHQKVIKRWWRNTQKSPLNEHLIEGFVRYCRALDSHEREFSLLQLWSALETLLGTSKYDSLVSRAVKLFNDEAAARQIAEHIRVRRNASVHAAIHPDHIEAETIVLQASRLVGRVLTFLANEDVPFKSPKELFQFLDLPLNSTDLKRQHMLISEFLSYRKGTGRWKKSVTSKNKPKKSQETNGSSHN